MKKQKTLLKSLIVVTLLISGCGGPPQSGGTDADESIFTDASSEAQADSQASDPSEAARRRRYVRVNARVFAKAIGAAEGGATRVMKLNLFDGESMTIVLEDVVRLSENNVTATGRIVGDSESAVTLVQNEDVLLVNVSRGNSDDRFEVRYVGEGLHKIRELLPKHDDEDCLEVGAPTASALIEEETLAQAIAANDLASPLATPQIDILGAYTPAARIKVGGTTAIKALIQLGVADTNRALADSGVALTARLVGIVAMISNETGNWSTDLSYLRS
ncbi:MAG: hypothetical protein AAB250_08490, partial [Bdellovibrionota bacterium]